MSWSPLRHASLGSWLVTDGALQQAVATNAALTSVDLSGAGAAITDAGIAALARGLPSLERLDLTGSSVTDRGLSSLVKQCPDIKALRLDCCAAVSSRGLKHIAAHAHQLRRLSLRGCELVSDSGVAALANLRHLEDVDLSDCPRLGSPGVGAALDGCPALRCLALRRVPLDICVADLSCEKVSWGFLHHPGYAAIIALDLTSSSITNGSLAWLAAKTGLLERLVLADCIELGDVALKSVGQTCLRLREIDVSGCYRMTDEGIRLLLANALRGSSSGGSNGSGGGSGSGGGLLGKQGRQGTGQGVGQGDADIRPYSAAAAGEKGRPPRRARGGTGRGEDRSGGGRAANSTDHPLGLVAVGISGCPLVTDRGLHLLISCCPDLQRLDADFDLSSKSPAAVAAAAGRDRASGASRGGRGGRDERGGRGGQSGNDHGSDYGDWGSGGDDGDDDDDDDDDDEDNGEDISIEDHDFDLGLDGAGSGREGRRRSRRRGRGRGGDRGRETSPVDQPRVSGDEILAALTSNCGRLEELGVGGRGGVGGITDHGLVQLSQSGRAGFREAGDHTAANLALGRGAHTKQSSTLAGRHAGMAVNDDTSGFYGATFNDPAATTTHTKPEDDPWWTLDLGKDADVSVVRVWLTQDALHMAHNFPLWMMVATEAGGAGEATGDALMMGDEGGFSVEPNDADAVPAWCHWEPGSAIRAAVGANHVGRLAGTSRDKAIGWVPFNSRDDGIRRAGSGACPFVPSGTAPPHPPPAVSAFMDDARLHKARSMAQATRRFTRPQRVLTWRVYRRCRYVRVQVEGADKALTVGEVQVFERGVQRLRLAGCDGITDLGLHALSRGFTDLTDLDLSYCERVSDRGLCDICNGCPRLLRLDLEGCKGITDHAFQSLDQMLEPWQRAPSTEAVAEDADTTAGGATAKAKATATGEGAEEGGRVWDVAVGRGRWAQHLAGASGVAPRSLSASLPLPLSRSAPPKVTQTGWGEVPGSPSSSPSTNPMGASASAGMGAGMGMEEEVGADVGRPPRVDGLWVGTGRPRRRRRQGFRVPFCHLRWLRLSNCRQITNDGVAAVARIWGDSLEELDISRLPHLAADVFPELSAAAPGLCYVNVSGCPAVPPPAVASLATTLPRGTLWVNELYEVMGVRPVAEAPQLKLQQRWCDRASRLEASARCVQFYARDWLRRRRFADACVVGAKEVQRLFRGFLGRRVEFNMRRERHANGVAALSSSSAPPSTSSWASTLPTSPTSLTSPSSPVTSATTTQGTANDGIHGGRDSIAERPTAAVTLTAEAATFDSDEEDTPPPARKSNVSSSTFANPAMLLLARNTSRTLHAMGNELRAKREAAAFRTAQRNVAVRLIQRSFRYARRVRELRADRVLEVNMVAMGRAHKSLLAVRIQANWRMHVQYMWFEEFKRAPLRQRNNAAVVLQCWARGIAAVMARRRVRTERRQHAHQMRLAARLVQRRWRCHAAQRDGQQELTRRRDIQMGEAATNVQCAWRKKGARRERMRLARERAERLVAEEAAVLVIQGAYRCRGARALMAAQRTLVRQRLAAACLIQNAWRVKQARREMLIRRLFRGAQEHAAGVIQRALRVHFDRRWEAQQRVAALFRGRRMYEAAKRIQRLFRYFNQRRRWTIVIAIAVEAARKERMRRTFLAWAQVEKEPPITLEQLRAKHNAMKCIQRMVRAHRRRNILYRQVRMRRLRRYEGEVAAQQQAVLDRAVRGVQCRFRGKLCRASLLQMKLKGHVSEAASAEKQKARMLENAKRGMLMIALNTAASVQLQKVARGWRARLHLARRRADIKATEKAAVKQLQGVRRIRNAQQEMRRRREDKDQVKMQDELFNQPSILKARILQLGRFFARHTRTKIRMGDIVLARWHGYANAYRGRVIGINAPSRRIESETYDVRYDDASTERRVARDYIRLIRHDSLWRGESDEAVEAHRLEKSAERVLATAAKTQASRRGGGGLWSLLTAGGRRLKHAQEDAEAARTDLSILEDMPGAVGLREGISDIKLVCGERENSLFGKEQQVLAKHGKPAFVKIPVDLRQRLRYNTNDRLCVHLWFMRRATPEVLVDIRNDVSVLVAQKRDRGKGSISQQPVVEMSSTAMNAMRKAQGGESGPEGGGQGQGGGGGGDTISQADRFPRRRMEGYVK